MRITGQLSDGAILREVGSRLAGARLARNLTQAALAEEAGVGGGRGTAVWSGARLSRLGHRGPLGRARPIAHGQSGRTVEIGRPSSETRVRPRPVGNVDEAEMEMGR
jgi:hypothetical protein